ncbi:MAG: Gfo/Idh/MocA family protein [Candidatus Hodarchaeales archaeon]|jgi:predicted dehydrogenase
MKNVGIAGLGKMGKLHFKNSFKNKKINIVAIADLKKSNLRISENNKINKYTDYKEMIESEKLDAIIISLPNFLKKESIYYASEKNLPIYIDKPLARNLSEAKDIIKITENNGTQLTVGVNYRYFKSIRKVYELVDQGTIGDIVLGTSELIMDGPFSHPLIPAPVADWWFSKELSGGGVLMDLGYHVIDLLSWMLGELHVEHVEMMYRYNLPIEDAATLILKSKSGTRCTVNVGWFSKTLFPNFNFRINLHGTAGYTSTDHYAPRNMYLNAAKEGIKNLFKKVTLRDPEYLSYTYYYSSFYEILDHFIESINSDKINMIDINNQLNVMKTIDSAYTKGYDKHID